MQRCSLLLVPTALTLLLSGCLTLSPSSSQSETTKQLPAQEQTGSSIMSGQTTTSAVPVATLSTALELQALIASKKVIELRTTYNGIYGASLLFNSERLEYFVAQFQRNDFWRVNKVNNAEQAEKTYAIFSQNTKELAQADIDRIRLQAEYAFMEKQLAARSTELTALRSDLAIQRKYEQNIAQQQQRTREETVRLNDQQQTAQAQLRALQRQIAELEAQKNQLEFELTP